MSQISFEDLVNGTVPDASDFNTRLNALKSRINNGMEADNIADSAVTTAKINNSAVTYLKLNNQIVQSATTVTAVSTDYVAIADTSDSGNYKKALVSDIAPAAASQAQMEAVSSNTVMATPLSLKWHPGIAKAWVIFNGTTGATIASYNVTDVTDNGGNGDFTVNFTTAFSSANYVVIATPGNYNTNTHGRANPVDASSARIGVYNTANTAVDCEVVSVVAYGDQ